MNRKYIITDPCYLIDNEKWQELTATHLGENGELTHDFFKAFGKEVCEQNEHIQALLELKHTQHGDGSYFITPCHAKITAKIFEFWVDSGLYCICEVSDFCKFENDDGVAMLEFQAADDFTTPKYDENLSDDEQAYFSSNINGENRSLFKIDWNDGDFDDDDDDDDDDDFDDD